MYYVDTTYHFLGRPLRTRRVVYSRRESGTTLVPFAGRTVNRQQGSGPRGELRDRGKTDESNDGTTRYGLIVNRGGGQKMGRK